MLDQPGEVAALLRQSADVDGLRINLARRLDERLGASVALDVLPEAKLPPFSHEPPKGAGPAVVGAMSTSFKARGTGRITLPAGTRVEVLKTAKSEAQVAVPLARAVLFDAHGEHPSNVDAVRAEGTVSVAALTTDLATALNWANHAAGLQEQPIQAMAALAGWHRVWMATSGASVTRKPLATLAFGLDQSAPLLDAALGPPMLRARQLTLGLCRGDLLKAAASRQDSSCQWLPRSAACMSGPPIDTLLLRMTVDASSPGIVWLVSTPIERVQDERGAYTLDVMRGRLRRLVIPPGGPSTTVAVAVSPELGMEHAVYAAAGEPLARAHHRARGSYRWTLGDDGALDAFLGPDDTDFKLPYAAHIESVVLPPECL